MKAKRITSRRIGDTPTPHTNERSDINLVRFGLLSTVVMIIASTIALRTMRPASVAQVTVTATPTLAPTQTTLPTSTAMPTSLPVTLTPLPTIAIERGTVLAQVWLYDAPGGNRLPAGLLAGQEVTVLESRDGFVKVMWDGGDTAIVGWVAERWISIQEGE